mmetsp:Transcript_7520/g.11244  ORF Transcript_7520/g.11244 Transcript_7520/m.11244 type:complete len:196 (-) Transcript_7520:42-629(-)|eukprot:CAMPEP_0171453408 /NCGR_PEP_ID=MMETSP0945-20130129/1131_1 /TAXON_ID=109269 /ORGANISM="Vaucheria litorea, Strain CCMP2940" /LENGTH=195 /DNA_ID=CAMNT_0011978275 /DNA_START=42 /DNA_END=629 /DNA_ORIENTATION=-
MAAATEEEPKIQEISSEDGAPAGSEEAAGDAPALSGPDGPANRNEKKARKALAKLNLQPVAGINKVVVKRVPNSVLFVVNNPEVLRNPGTDSYIVYGIASTMGEEQANLARAAQQFSQMAAAGGAPGADAAAAGEGAGADAATEEEGEVDETGLDAKDIDLVVAQAKCSRAKAAATLRANDGDVVNSVLELSTQS